MTLTANRRGGSLVGSSRSPLRALCHAGQPACSTGCNRPAATGSSQTRRQLLNAAPALVAAAGLLFAPQPVLASTAVTDFWKSRQRQNGAVKLLAPLRAAQQRLQAASDMLDAPRAGIELAGGEAVAVPAAAAEEVLKEALQAVRASSLNCYVFEPMEDDTFETRASIWTQKFVNAADPCTFRIILKTVTSFESPEVKQQAADMMQGLVLGYQKLDTYLEMARLGNPDALPKAKEQLQATLVTARDIETFVAGVLRV